MSKVLAKTVVLMGEDGRALVLPVGTPATDDLLGRITMESNWVEAEVTPVVEPEPTVPVEASGEDTDGAERAGDEGDSGEEAAEAAEPTRYDDFKNDALREALDERGLDTKGNKAELIARLVEDDANAQ